MAAAVGGPEHLPSHTPRGCREWPGWEPVYTAPLLSKPAETAPVGTQGCAGLWGSSAPYRPPGGPRNRPFLGSTEACAQLKVSNAQEDREQQLGRKWAGLEGVRGQALEPPPCLVLCVCLCVCVSERRHTGEL